MSPQKVTLLATATATAVAAFSTFKLYQLSKSRGSVASALRLIWEGDLEQARCLEEAEVLLAETQSSVSQIEEALDRARLDTVDDSRNNSATDNKNKNNPNSKNNKRDVLDRWKHNYRTNINDYNADLRAALATANDACDKVAAMVDSIILSSSQDVEEDTFLEQLRQKKKLLSKTIVLDSERVDALIASFQVLSE
mmetsp:Transcript_20359/g.48409  ORF Transcript_20359/g.48409 Transcript_20359/m.48409 type:complete len:196 (+) Transcript_20359:130-717(+)